MGGQGVVASHGAMEIEVAKMSISTFGDSTSLLL